MEKKMETTIMEYGDYKVYIGNQKSMSTSTLAS